MIRKYLKFKYILPSFLVALFLSIDLESFFNQEILEKAFETMHTPLLFLVLFVVTLFLYFQSSQLHFSKKNNAWNIISAITIGLALTLGQGFAIDDSWSIYYSSTTGWVVFLLKWLGFASITYDILRLILRALYDKSFLKIKPLNWKPKLYQLFLIIFIPKLIAIIFFLPNAVIHYEGGSGPYNFGDLFHGWIIYLLMAILQASLFSIFFTLTVGQLIRWKVPKWLSIGVLITYSIAPIWLIASYDFTAEFLFFSILAILYFIFVHLINLRRKGSVAALFLIGLLMTVGYVALRTESLYEYKYPNIAVQQIHRTYIKKSDSINPKIKNDLDLAFYSVNKAEEHFDSNYVTESLKYDFEESLGRNPHRVFWSDWLALFKKYPLEYAQGFFGLNYQYYYPLNVDRNYYSKNQISMADNYFNKIPVLNWLTNVGFYSLLLLFLFGYSVINKKGQLIVAGIPLVIIWIFCLNSPVNGFLLYSFPILAILPLYLGYFVYKNNSSK